MERAGALYLLGTPVTEKERFRLRFSAFGRLGGSIESRRLVAAMMVAMRMVSPVARRIGRIIVKV